VVLAGVVAALKLIGGSLADHTFLFLGAGEVFLPFSGLISIHLSLMLKQSETTSGIE